MFLLIMTSSIDLGLQNPIANTNAANPVLSVLPAYGAMQSTVTSIGLHLVPSSYLTLGMC
jgi:ABC-2 type transport system permease protein